MTAKSFVDTNIVIYAEGSGIDKAQRATAILESSSVISSQVVTETISTLTRKYGLTLTQAHEVALGLIDLCEVVPVSADTMAAPRNPDRLFNSGTATEIRRIRGILHC